MPKRQNEIIDAEFTPVQEAAKEGQEQKVVQFNFDNVAEMVLVGRYKDGREFVQPVNFDDALKAKMYLDYGTRYFDMIIDKAIFERIKAYQDAAAKEQKTDVQS
jgi:hypothetical protein